MDIQNENLLEEKTIRPLYEGVLLLIATGVAVILRFYRLGTWSLWGDEVFTLTGKEDGFNFSLLRRSLASDLIRATTSALGTSEWSARLVPAIIGVLSIPILYFMVRKLFGARVALFSAGLLAVSTWHIYWSQNARFYTLLLLFYTLSMLAFYIGMEEDSPWWVAGSLVFLGLAARERLIALVFVPVVVVYLLALKFLPGEKPSGWRPRNLAIFFTPGLVLAVLIAGPFLRNLPGWFAGFARINNNPVWILAGVVYYVGLPVICTGLAGALYLWAERTRSARHSRAALYFGLGAVVPLVAIMGTSVFQYSANRYIFVSLTSWIILAGLALEALFGLFPGSRVVLALGVFALLFGSSLSEDLLYFQYQNGNRDDWKSAFAYVQAHRQPGDRVISANQEVARYYLGEITGGFQWLDTAAIETEGRTWFVEDLNVGDLFPDKQAWLVQNARLVANFDVHAYARVFVMRVYLYDPAQMVNR